MISKETEQLYLSDAPKIITFVIKKNLSALQYYGGFEDMRQALMLELWKALPFFDPKRGRFTTFAIKCCNNEILKQKRKAKAKKRDGFIVSMEEQITEDLKIADILEDKTDFVEKIINTYACEQVLPKLSRETYLYYLEGKPQKEIAKIEQKTQACVSRRIKSNICHIRRFYEQNTRIM